MEDSSILKLPNTAWKVVLQSLDVASLLRLANVCKLLRQEVFEDLIVWKPLCAKFGVTNHDAYHCENFRSLYLNLLHPYGALLGLWKDDMSPVGCLLVIHADNSSGSIKGSAVVATALNGKCVVRDVLSIKFGSEGVLQKHCCLRNAAEGEQPHGHHHGGDHNVDLELEMSESEVTAFTAVCSSACQFDTVELGARMLVWNHVPHTYQLPDELVQQLVPASQRAGGEQRWPEVVGSEADRVLLWMLETLTHLESWRGRAQLNRAHFVPLTTPHGRHELEGLWRGSYGPNGVEIIQVEYDDERPTCLQGTKITGDVNVPAGQTSFRIFLDEPVSDTPQGTPFVLDPDLHARVDLEDGAAERLVEYARYNAVGQVANVQYTDPHFMDVEAVKFGPNCFGVLWPFTEGQMLSVFTRLHL